jgi:cytochrome c5
MKLELCACAIATVLVAAAGGANAADGQAVYNQDCALCHNAMSPKLGDKAAWAPLIKEGNAALVASTVKGKGAMPARGGHSDLSDADAKAAVEYMESQGQ